MKTNATIRPTLCAALLFVSLSASAPASAFNEISLRVSNSHFFDDGIYAVSNGNQLVQAEFCYARALFDAQRGLWAEMSWTFGRRKSELFGAQLDTDAGFHSVTIGARYTYPLWSWLVPQARAGLGLAIGTLSLSGSATSVGGATGEMSDAAVGFSAYMLAGVELLIPRRWMRDDDRGGITGGLVIEGGFVLSSPLSYDLSPEQDDDLRNIPLSGTNFGDISLTAGVIRIGAVLRF